LCPKISPEFGAERVMDRRGRLSQVRRAQRSQVALKRVGSISRSWRYRLTPAATKKILCKQLDTRSSETFPALALFLKALQAREGRYYIRPSGIVVVFVPRGTMELFRNFHRQVEGAAHTLNQEPGHAALLYFADGGLVFSDRADNRTTHFQDHVP
jgi:hypothetical protein